jgi:hypothetical protein
LPLKVRTQTFGENKDEPLSLVENGTKYRIFNCYDCHSEYGYERRMTTSDNYYLEQTDFKMTPDVEVRARKIYVHLLEIARRQFDLYTISDPPPHLLDYRLNQMLQHCIWYELFLIFSPQDINTDLTVMFNMRNFGYYGLTMAPCGYVGEGYKEIEQLHILPPRSIQF